MKHRVCAAALAASGLTLGSLAAVAQPYPEPGIVQIDTLSVFDTLYHLSGGGGNVLALVDESEGGGVVLVDTKYPGWGSAVRDAVAQVTDLPITTIIATHAHAGHAGAIAEYPAATRIITHESSREALADAGWGATPTETFADRLSLLEGPDRIELYRFGPAHTAGDVVVVFPEKGVAYLGDLFPSRAVPRIDPGAGGSGVAFADTLDKVVAGIEGVTRVITGHGEFPSTYAGRGRRETGADRAWTGWMTWDDVAEYADFAREFLAAAEAAYAAGLTVDEAANTLVLPDRFAGYDLGAARETIEVIYAELAAR